jgi:hypothetical protein
VDVAVPEAAQAAGEPATDDAAAAVPTPAATRRRDVWRQRGQALPLLAIMLVALIGFTGLALDVSLLLLRTLQQQRAADAAALAGVIHLPDHLDQSLLTAREYARLNGFPHTPNGLPQVAVARVSPYTTRLRVTITATHEVYFMRIFGIQTVGVTRSAEAQYALPVRMGCPTCYTFGLGNRTPIAPSIAADCSHCILNQPDYDRYQKFWLSINGPNTSVKDGDAYNSIYDSDGGYITGCPPQVTPSAGNPDYRGSGIVGGYNYGVHVNSGRSALTLYVYDPAQYYVSGAPNGTDFDTSDTEPCAAGYGNPARFTVFYKLYWDPLNTPQYYGDDQLLQTTSFTFGTSQRDRWAPLWTLPTDKGELRVQVVTDANQGIGRNQYSLALGGQRAPGNDETIYGIDSLSTLMNISPPLTAVPGPTQVSFYLASIPTEHRDEQMDIRAFDLGDGSCTTLVQVLQQDVTCGGGDPTRPDCYNPVQFRWSATTNPPIPFGNPVGYVQTSSTSPVSNPFNGAWLTMRVDLPHDYTTSWWKILYAINGCQASGGRGVTDRTTWTIQMLGNPIHLVDGNP